MTAGLLILLMVVAMLVAWSLHDDDPPGSLPV